MKNFYSIILISFLTLTVLGGTFLFGTYVGYESKPALDKVSNVTNPELFKPETVDFSPFWETWNLIDEKYVNGTSTPDLKRQEMVWGAISGMVQALDDPYTTFLPPVENKSFEESITGNFSGVGMEVGVKDGGLIVISPLPNTPAKKAGIKAGDRIIKIDEAVTSLLTVDEAVNLIRGPKGTTVVLTIVRPEENTTEEIKIVRDNIDIPILETKIEDDIFIISLYNFNAQSTTVFKKALEDFVQSGRSKLVLDLRGNPGGFLDAAVEIASWFVAKNEVVVWEHRGDDEKNIAYRSRGYDLPITDLKMIVLVDGGSASASEILAGALREHGVATLVGQTTFGKGSVQELVPVTSETSLKVTVARWLTPDGHSISLGGLLPDEAVEMTLADFEAGKDPQLARALEILNQASNL